MKIFHGRVIGERRPMTLSGQKEKRFIELEWVDEESEEDQRFKIHQTLHLSDVQGEFNVGDAISVTINKIM